MKIVLVILLGLLIAVWLVAASYERNGKFGLYLVGCVYFALFIYLLHYLF